MISAFIRFVCLGLVALFYRRIRLDHRQHLPQEGPVIVVANHQNGLIDPMVVRMALGRPVAFLGKSTLFANRLGRAAMAAFDAVPVYRAHEADTVQNKSTFALCHTLLAKKGWLMLFPEGISHSELVLQPLKTGAARIALASEAQAEFRLGVRIVPIGLTYDAKDTFRSQVTASVGAPFQFGDLEQLHTEDPRAAAQALTTRIAEHLREVMLEAEDRELWNGFRFVARWLAADNQDATARRLAGAYRTLRTDAPEQADALVSEAREFARAVSAVGVSDPRALDFVLTPGRFVAGLLPTLLLWPFALLGALLLWPPYRLTRPLAVFFARNESDLVSTFKALLGMVLIGAWALAEAGVAAALLGAGAGVAVFVLAPICGYIAVRYAEQLSVRRKLLHAWRLRFSRKQALDEIARRRAALAAHLAKTLG